MVVDKTDNDMTESIDSINSSDDEETDDEETDDEDILYDNIESPVVCYPLLHSGYGRYQHKTI